MEDELQPPRQFDNKLQSMSHGRWFTIPQDFPNHRLLNRFAKAKDVEDLVTPCYVGYLSVIQRNAERMLQRAKHLGCQLRPHMKTHKTIEGAFCGVFFG